MGASRSTSSAAGSAASSRAIGEPWLDHDERYRRSEEFIRCLRGIWTEDTFTFAGDFYRFRDYSMKPKPIDPQPEIFQGGSSRAARDMAARVSDWYFTNGNTPEGIGKQVDDIRDKAAAERPHGEDRRQRLRHRPRHRGRGAARCSTRSSPRPTPTR